MDPEELDPEQADLAEHGFEPFEQEGESLLGGDDPVAVATQSVAAPSADAPATAGAGPVPEAPAAPLALYRRYRPDTFAEVIGQEHVTDPLQRALTNNRVNHAYLFSGPRGCGKTTSARILARCLNCEQGPTPTPCGECQSCRDLARGGPGSIDVIEIDAASHGGVDDARDLRERAFFAPVHSRYKVYIVDEAHMVTTAGFNAMLKLVEEPPPHVKFVFATTEPEKVIGTIRSRTHHYPFRLVPPKTLQGYLAGLCEAEGISVEPAVLPLVVRAGAGSVRDSLSVLDQLLGGAAEAGVSYAQAAALLGYTPDSLLDEILDAFAAGDAGGVFATVDKVIEVGQDPRRFAEDLLRRLRDLVIVAAVPDALGSGLVDAAEDQAERLQSQAAALGAGELTRAAEVIATGLTEMRGTTAPRLHLELMCARVLLPGADAGDRGLHARLDRLERRVGVEGAVREESGPVAGVRHPAERQPTIPGGSSAQPEPVPHRPAPEVSTSRPAEPRPEDHRSAESRPEEHRPVEPRPEEHGPAESRPEEPRSGHSRPGEHAPREPEAPHRRPDAATGSAPERQPEAAPAERPAPAAQEAQQPGLTTADVRRLWPEVLEEIKQRRRFTWILVSQNAQVADVRDGKLLLAMKNAGARERFGQGGNDDVLADALVQVLGANLSIETMVEGGAVPTRGARPSADAGHQARPAASAEPGHENRSGAPTRDPWASGGGGPSSQTQARPVSHSPAPSSDHPRPPAAHDQEPPEPDPEEPEPEDDDPRYRDPAGEHPGPDPERGESERAAGPGEIRTPPGSAETPTAEPGPPWGQHADNLAARARQGIRQTRHGRQPAEAPEDPDYDESYDGIEEGAPVSTADLLTKHLGAELIGEEEPGA